MWYHIDKQANRENKVYCKDGNILDGVLKTMELQENEIKINKGINALHRDEKVINITFMCENHNQIGR